MITGNKTMNIEQIREHCLRLPGVTEDMPFGEDVVTFRIEGKIFLCLWLGADNPRFAMKLAPERGEELREKYDAVTPAYHWNKKHWSDFAYEQLDARLLASWMEESYHLVLHALPKRLRERWINDCQGERDESVCEDF